MEVIGDGGQQVMLLEKRTRLIVVYTPKGYHSCWSRQMNKLYFNSIHTYININECIIHIHEIYFII